MPKLHKREQSHPDKPTNGVCCFCGFSGDEEAVCPDSSDKNHCDHWFDGPDGDNKKEFVGWASTG